MFRKVLFTVFFLISLLILYKEDFIIFLIFSLIIHYLWLVVENFELLKINKNKKDYSFIAVLNVFVVSLMLLNFICLIFTFSFLVRMLIISLPTIYLKLYVFINLTVFVFTFILNYFILLKAIIKFDATFKQNILKIVYSLYYPVGVYLLNYKK